MLIPTIHFAGNCDEVIQFYVNTIGARVQMIAYAKDSPEDTGLAPNNVMHSQLEIFGTVVALTDGCEKPPTEPNHTFTVMFDTAQEVIDVFNKLAPGGKIIDPLGEQFWADMTGMLTDRFGVNWCLLTKTMPNS